MTNAKSSMPIVLEETVLNVQGIMFYTTFKLVTNALMGCKIQEKLVMMRTSIIKTVVTHNVRLKMDSNVDHFQVFVVTIVVTD